MHFLKYFFNLSDSHLGFNWIYHMHKLTADCLRTHFLDAILESTQMLRYTKYSKSNAPNKKKPEESIHR